MSLFRITESREALGNHAAPDSLAYQYGLLPTGTTEVPSYVTERGGLVTRTVQTVGWIGPEVEGFDPRQAMEVDRLRELARTQQFAFELLQDMGVEVSK